MTQKDSKLRVVSTSGCGAGGRSGGAGGLGGMGGDGGNDVQQLMHAAQPASLSSSHVIIATKLEHVALPAPHGAARHSSTGTAGGGGGSSDHL